MPAGRPIIYNESFVSEAHKYIDLCEDETRQVISGQSDKFTSYQEKLTVNLPTIEGLALYLKIHKDTVYEWEKTYPEFSDVTNILRAKQAVKLVNSGLSGDYNPVIAKLLLAKHGYKDAQEVEVAAKIDFRDAE